MELMSYLFSMFAVFFWIFRISVSIAPNFNGSLPFLSANPNIEIILLFISLIGLIGIFKRKTFLTAIYLAGFFAYYGYEISLILNNSKESLSSYDTQYIFIYALGVLIAFLNFLDVLLNKERKGSVKNEKLDWYYDKGNFEREIDERADRNQYRIK